MSQHLNSVADMMNTRITYILLVVFSFIASQNFLCAQNELMHISVVLPEVTNKSIRNLDKRIKTEIERAIVESTGIARLVERDNFEDLQRWHNMLSAIDNPLVPSDNLKGADYLLKATFQKFKIEVKSVGKIARKYIKSDIEFELIDIETGEVANSYKAEPIGYYWSSDKSEDIYDALDDFNSCLRTVVKYMLLQFSQTKIELIDIEENEDGKVKFITIEGGLKGPYFEKLEMDIISIYYTEFQGERIKRNKTIGSCKVKDIFGDYTICEIKSRSEDILAEIKVGNKLYCVPKNLKHISSCDGKLETKQRRKRLSNLVEDATGK